MTQQTTTMATGLAEPIAWIVRHGQSTWNVLGMVQGHADQAALTERGRDEARDAASQLTGRPIGALYTSDLRRARETAFVVAQALGLPVRTDPALRERCLGELEGGPVSALTPDVTGIRGHEVVDVHACPPGGESLAELQRRVAGFADRLRREGHRYDVVVIAHGGSVRALRACCAGRPIDAAGWDAVPNGSVWAVRMPTCSGGTAGVCEAAPTRAVPGAYRAPAEAGPRGSSVPGITESMAAIGQRKGVR